MTAAPRPLEWPTIGLALLVYAILGSMIWFHASLPWWLILAVGSYFTALHTSLQHEVLHGHPTRSRLFNESLIFLSPALWVPFQRYKETHLQHHNNQYLTDPGKDPESFYLLPDDWANMPGVKRSLCEINHTLGGRMLLGPAISIIRFWSADICDIMAGNRSKAKAWAAFVLSCALVLSYVIWCGMPVWQYIVLVAYPGISLAMVRAYCEHQAAEIVDHRTILVECSVFWSLLFLNNNLHIAHHERPFLAWYKLPAYYAAEREELLARNNGYCLSYAQIFWRYFFRAKEPLSYPDVSWLKP
jgi:fatty acid desaturase